MNYSHSLFDNLPDMNTNLDQWEALQAVARWGGFAQASARLNRSQSTISYAIHRLAEGVGIRLFECVGRKAQLTESGRGTPFESLATLAVAVP